MNSKPIRLASRYRKGAEVIRRDLEALNQILDLDDLLILEKPCGLRFYARTLYQLTQMLEHRATVLEGGQVVGPIGASVDGTRKYRGIHRAT